MSIEQKLAQNGLIFKCLSGSRAYGTNREDSDYDYTGVFIAPKDYHLGLYKRVEQVLSSDDGETTIFEINKFFRLCAECNPNIIEMMFNPPENILFSSPIWERILQNKHLFLSKKAKHTFAGYANSQLKRINTHQKWINNPHPVDPPSIHQYCTILNENGISVKADETDIRLINKECFLVRLYDNSYKIYRSNSIPGGIVDEQEQNLKFLKDLPNVNDAQYMGILFCDTDQFQSEIVRHRQYWEWKTNRNKVRAALEEKSGYDTKHAMHLVRLLNMCEEILTEGLIKVRRPDAEFLKSIRNGAFSYDELITWAECKELSIDELYNNSSLRDKPDLVAIDELLISIKEEFWK
jgi:predicted nucleotidyltransferase